MITIPIVRPRNACKPKPSEGLRALAAVGAVSIVLVKVPPMNDEVAAGDGALSTCSNTAVAVDQGSRR
jgi:hypothetical protein